jgi:hypothetical protein
MVFIFNSIVKISIINYELSIKGKVEREKGKVEREKGKVEREKLKVKREK